MSIYPRSFLIALTPVLALGACDPSDAEIHATVGRAVVATDFDAGAPPAPVVVTAPPYAIPTGEITGGPNGNCDIEGVTCRDGHQGRTLTGAPAPSFQLASAFWQPGTTPQTLDATKNVDWRGFDLRVGGRRLGNSELTGLSFAISTTGYVTIKQATTDSAQHGRYRVAYSMNGGTPVTMCPNDTAYVIPGHLATSTLYQDSTTSASFVCHNSAAGKAIAFGYSPRGFTGAIQSNFFLAGTRMARADYCGTNTPNTIDGTNVMYYDVDGLVNHADHTPSPPGPGDGRPYYFEAAWRDGIRAKVLCLSKLRWQVLPPRDFCTGGLRDPRLYHDHDVAFCEDLGQFGSSGSLALFLHNLRNKGALLFSSSQFNDIGLYVWHSGQSTITTTRGFWGGVSGGTRPPVPDAGYDNDTPTYVASVLTAEDPGKTKPLRLYFNPTTQTYRSSISPPSDWCGNPGCLPNSWTAVPDEEGGLVGYVYYEGHDVPADHTGVPLHVWGTTPVGTDIENTRFILLPEGVEGPAPFTFDYNQTEGYGLVEKILGI
jgi:hypothetical protein